MVGIRSGQPYKIFQMLFMNSFFCLSYTDTWVLFVEYED